MGPHAQVTACSLAASASAFHTYLRPSHWYHVTLTVDCAVLQGTLRLRIRGQRAAKRSCCFRKLLQRSLCEQQLCETCMPGSASCRHRVTARLLLNTLEALVCVALLPAAALQCTVPFPYIYMCVCVCVCVYVCIYICIYIYMYMYIYMYI
jgi:hypothetical protein